MDFSMRHLAIAAFTFAVGQLCSPAFAESDCASKAFATLLEDTSFTCKEVQTAIVTGFASDVTLRSVVDAKDPGAADAEAQVFAAVQEALTRMAAIDSGMKLKLGDVTVVLMRAGAKNSQDLAKSKVLGAAQQDGSDCVLQLYPARLAEQGKDPLGVLQMTVAHELFHCVQYATWPDLMAEYDAHKWWVEGTAETVAQAVFPNFDEAFRWSYDFSDKFRDTPLTQLTYHNVVFFSWVWAQDPKLVFQIISAMPVGGDEAAQQKALLGVIPAAELSRFVRDFLDNKVVTPGGADPMFGEIPLQMTTNIGLATFEETSSKDLTAAPFTMFAVDVSFSGGAYEIDIKDTGPVLSQHRDTQATAWTTGKIAADGDCTTTVTYRLAGMATGPAKVNVSAKKNTKGRDCRACAAQAARDQCLIGTWRIDNTVQGMSIAQYVGNGRPVGAVVVGKNFLRLVEDGTSYWAYQNFLIAVQDQTVKSPIAGAVLNGTIDQGWSAADGRLNTCYVRSDATIKLATEGGNVGDAVNVSTYATADQVESYDYECRPDGTLLLEKRLGDASFLMKLRRLD
jgi:hypothetical protein